jgi:hypothetical protein
MIVISKNKDFRPKSLICTSNGPKRSRKSLTRKPSYSATIAQSQPATFLVETTNSVARPVAEENLGWAIEYREVPAFREPTRNTDRGALD